MEITHLHVEASTHCNARCPGCPRNAYGVNLPDFIPLQHLTLDNFQKILQRYPKLDSINFNANLGDPMMNPVIDELVQAFGSQCVVIGIDSIAEGEAYTVRSHTGTPDHMRAPGKKTLDWIAEVEVRGAGEIVLNCMSADGTRSGYDIDQLQAARATTSLPLIASGGAGTPGHFLEAFRVADVDGALAATVFHSGQIAIPELKNYLISEGIGVRPC